MNCGLGGGQFSGTGGAADRNFVGSVHFPAVIHLHERVVRVAQVVVVSQRDGRELNGLACGVHTAVGNVRVRETVEKIIRACDSLGKSQPHV